MARLVVVTGPIAAGKNTVAALLAEGLVSRGRSVVVADVDEVAAMVAGPGAAATGLWSAAHGAHGALVAGWLRSAVDVVIAVGPFYSAEEQATLTDPLPEGSVVHRVVVDAPVSVTLARAQGDPGRVRSRDPVFHAERHRRFRALLPGIRADQTFDSAHLSAREIATAILDAVAPRV